MRKLVLALLLGTGACVIPFEDDGAPCNADHECLPGYVCGLGYCRAETDAVKLEGIGPEGGELVAAGGLRIVVPPGALLERTVFVAEPLRAGAVIAGVEVLHDGWWIEPQDVALAAPVTVVMPVPASAMDAPGFELNVYNREAKGAEWRAVESECEASLVFGHTTSLGGFTAGLAR